MQQQTPVQPKQKLARLGWVTFGVSFLLIILGSSSNDTGLSCFGGLLFIGLLIAVVIVASQNEKHKNEQRQLQYQQQQYEQEQREKAYELYRKTQREEPDELARRASELVWQQTKLSWKQQELNTEQDEINRLWNMYPAPEARLITAKEQEKLDHKQEKLDKQKEILEHQADELYRKLMYRASNAQGASRYIPDEIRRDVLARDNYQCVQCGSTQYLELDHIIPFTKGGASTVENLQVLCHSCNQKKGNR